MSDSGIIHPLVVNAELGIDILQSDNGPVTDHPDAPLASKAYNPSTGTWYTKLSSGWEQDGAVADSYTKTESDARYLQLSGGTLTGDLAGTRITLHDNILYESYTDANANLAMNYVGYAGGTTQFRDFSVYDGKSSSILYITGSTKDAAFSGAVTATRAAFGASPATAGAVGIPNEVSLASRNAANSADTALIFLDASDNVTIGDSSAASVIAAKAITAPDFVLA